MREKLTAVELEVFATAFGTEMSARQFLEQVGVGRDRQPLWNVA